LLAAVAAHPRSAEARYKLAEAQVGLGQFAAAIDSCIASLKAEPGWNGGAARTLALKTFEQLGPGHPAVTAGRKAMSKVLFR
jgi:putative thioredoxin